MKIDQPSYTLKATRAFGATSVARGLYFTGAYMLRTNKLVRLLFGTLQTVPVTPGKEAVLVLDRPKLSPNADVSKVTATVQIAPPKELAEPVATTITVEGPAGGPVENASFKLSAAAPQQAQNVEIRLDGGDVIWQHAGLATAPSYEVPDFAEQLNAYLDVADATEASVELVFRIKADTPAQIGLQILDQDLVFTHIVTKVWENELDKTFRTDRNLTVTYGQTIAIPLDVSMEGNVQIKSVELDIAGELDEGRMLGPVVSHEGRQFGSVTSDYALAQAFTIDMPLTISGATLLAAWTEEAEFYLDLQPDAQGRPATADPLAKTTVILPAHDESRGEWVSAPFEQPAQLSPGLYWFVARGIRGNLRVGLARQDWRELGPALVNRGGRLWRDLIGTGDVKALFRPIYLPDFDNSTAALELAVGFNGERRPVEVTPSGARVTVTPGPESEVGKVPLIIRSNAQGSLSIANVVQRYK